MDDAARSANPRNEFLPRPARASRGRRAQALAVKRGIDLAGSVAASVILAPVLLWTAVAVAATEGLPILFRHERPGLHEKPFTMVEFRTMRPPRATRSGT